MKITTYPIVILTLMFLGITAQSNAQTQYWKLSMQDDTDIALGTFAAVGGLTDKDGVRFTLPAGTIHSPVIVTVLAVDSAKPVRLQAYKEENSPLFNEVTDKSGEVVCRLRTGEEIYFKVTGEAGVEYSLSVWRGPDIKLPISTPSVAMSTVLPLGTDTPGPNISVVPPEPSNSSPFIYLILVGIFIVLAVIAFLIFRGQQIKSKGTAVIAFALITLPFSERSLAEQQESIDKRPGNIEPGKRDPRLAEQASKAINSMEKGLGIIDGASGGKIALPSIPTPGGGSIDTMEALKAAVSLLEVFEIIDPREKFVQPDYNPKGLPVLPSRAIDDSELSTPERDKFNTLQGKINQAKTHLEENYVVLKQTELKTKRLEELADVAGGFSAIGGLYWSSIKANPNDPMNKSKAGFYTAYDTGQENGLTALNDALKEMAEFEMRNYSDRNWYLYFALPYYNFMVSRYVR